MKYLTLLVFLGISLLCEAQQDSIVPFEKAYKRTYNIRKVSGVKPTIDGKLDEDFWTKQGDSQQRHNGFGKTAATGNGDAGRSDSR